MTGTPPSGGERPPSGAGTPPSGSAAAFGRLRVLRPLGSGTFATVLLAHDPALDCLVAVKVLGDNWARQADVRQRFEDEGRLLRRVDDARVVRVHDVAEAPDGRPYLVMSYVAGGSLAARMADGRVAGLPDAALVQLVTDIADGLAALHRAGIVHRDLAPTNVLLDDVPDGGVRAVLTDLGVAKDLRWASGLTQPTGTGHYRAPEQLAYSADIGPATDVYAFAVLVGDLLQAAQRPAALGHPALVAALGRARRNEPSTRPQHAAEVLAAVALALSSASSAAPPPPPPPPPSPPHPPLPSSPSSSPDRRGQRQRSRGPRRGRAIRRRPIVLVAMAITAAVAAAAIAVVASRAAPRTTVATRDGRLQVALAGRWRAVGSASVPGAADSSGVAAERRDGDGRVEVAITDARLALDEVLAAAAPDACGRHEAVEVGRFDAVARRWTDCADGRTHIGAAVRSGRDGTIRVQLTGQGVPALGEVLAALRVPTGR